jgi:hypothetical protein
MRKTILFFKVLMMVASSSLFSQTVVYSVNCGSDTAIGEFLSDEYFVAGNIWSHEIFHSGYAADTTLILNPAPISVYTSLRYGKEFGYVFPELTPDGKYTVRLHFADDWGEPGKRIQDVMINGTKVLKDFDIYAAAGKMVAVIREYPATADEEGKITIDFETVVDNALISAIELIEGDTDISIFNTRKNPYNINSGSNVDLGHYSRDALAAGGGTWSFTIFHPEFEGGYRGTRTTCTSRGLYPAALWKPIQLCVPRSGS